MAKSQSKQNSLSEQMLSGLLFSSQPTVSSAPTKSDITDINIDDIIPYHREKINNAEEEITIFKDYS